MFVSIVGQPHTLACHIYFPFAENEEKKLRKVEWYVSLGGNMERTKRLENQT